MIRYCKNCARLGSFNDGTPGCILSKIQVNPVKDYCSQHLTKDQLVQCDICHAALPSKELIIWININETQTFYVCSNCLPRLS